MKRMKGWMNECSFVILDFNEKSEAIAIRYAAIALSDLAFITISTMTAFYHVEVLITAGAALSEDMQYVCTVVQSLHS